ncbi:MAG: LysM peptidoglycan-binding domain-containing protein [Brumimicrobium sp.]|nr:LysM peptidoglycan-binding domain-containing protein [Brumimicrobium sp.]
MKILLNIILILLNSGILLSQEIGQEIRGNRIYKIHLVEQGNTLYGLKQQYNTSIEAIIEENPGVEKGLLVGQKLYIPTDETPVSANTAPQTHEVKPKETLFGISRQYDLTVEELIRANPGVENGLQIGQNLIIPSDSHGADAHLTEDQVAEQTKESPKVHFQVDFKDSSIRYTVQKKETLYSISRRFMVPVEELTELNDIKNDKIKPGQELIIPLKKERIERVEVRKLTKTDSLSDSLRIKPLVRKDKYKIAILLPLKLESNAKVYSGLLDENTRLDYVTDVAVDFLMGAQMALDSLEKLGLSAEVHMVDTRGDMENLKSVFAQELFRDVDMVIGPFFPKLVEEAASWCGKNKVELVIPTSAPTMVLKDNPYVTSLVPSDLTLIGGMAKYLAEHHSTDKIYFIEDENQAVKDRMEYFRGIYQESLSPANKSNIIQATSLGSSSGRDFAAKIDVDGTTIFVCLSENTQKVMQFINALNAAKNISSTYGKANVIVVGTKEWADISSLNNYYRNRFQLHYASANYVNYDSDTTVQFIKNYNDRYGAYPSKYSFHGFDVVLSQGARLLPDLERNEGIINYFSMNNLGPTHGKENGTAFICKQEDFEIHLLDLIKMKSYFGAN